MLFRRVGVNNSKLLCRSFGTPQPPAVPTSQELAENFRSSEDCSIVQVCEILFVYIFPFLSWLPSLSNINNLYLYVLFS